MDKTLIEIINQTFEIEQKLIKDGIEASYTRPLFRIKSALESVGFQIQVPLGEPFHETRTDIEASIVGEISDQMVISRVIKPIIYYNQVLIQQAIVFVEAKN